MDHEVRTKIADDANTKVNAICAVGTVIGCALLGPVGLLVPFFGKAVAYKAARDKAKEIDEATGESALELAEEFDSSRNAGESNLRVDYRVGNVHRIHDFKFPDKEEGEE